MYPFSTNYSNNIFDTSQPVSNWPFIDENENSKLEDIDYSLFHFPSPYIHYEDDSLFLQDLHDLFLKQQQHLTSENSVAQATNDHMADSENTDFGKPKGDYIGKFGSVSEEIPRKSSKRDRHSKIYTAHGPRDRRMRLSLDVARNFFCLQDMLGYDKASKTIEWLLTKSKSAIKELARGFPHINHSCSVGANSALSSSDCEVISGFDESAIEGNHPVSVNTTKAKPYRNKVKKSTRGFRKNGFHPHARESREKARERARERTIEKRKLGESKVCVVEAMNNDLTGLGFWSPLETGEELGHKYMNPSYKFLPEVEKRSSNEKQFLGTRESIVGDSMTGSHNWSPSTNFSYQNNTEISHESQFTFRFMENHGRPTTT